MPMFTLPALADRPVCVCERDREAVNLYLLPFLVPGFGGGGLDMGAGWGLDGGGHEALFASLAPVAGLVTGEQVRELFQASQLSHNKLAQIW